MRPSSVIIKLNLSNILGLIHSVLCQGKDYEIALGELRDLFVKDFKPEEVIHSMFINDDFGHNIGIISICSMLYAYSKWEEKDIRKEMDKHNFTIRFREHRIRGLKGFLETLSGEYWGPVLKTAAALNEIQCYHTWIADGDLTFTDERIKHIYESRREKGGAQ